MMIAVAGGLTLPPYLCSAFCKVSLKNPSVASAVAVLVTQTCSRCSVTICLLIGERSREGLDSVTFTQLEQ